jgi:hypothetical protein
MSDQPKPTPDDLLAECDAEKDFEFGELQRFVDALRAAIKERDEIKRRHDSLLQRLKTKWQERQNVSDPHP